MVIIPTDMLLAVTTFFLLGMMATVAISTGQFAAEGEVFDRKWFLGWLLKGCLVPLFIWLLMNEGDMPLMPPLTREIEKLRAQGHEGMALTVQFWYGALCIIPWWMSLSYVWFLTALFRRSMNKEDIAVGLVLSGVPVVLIVALCLWAGSYILGGFFLAIWAITISFYSLSVSRTLKQIPPAYSAAIGKMKFGKYAEAEQVILAELEKCETDFDGWMMLAELYATHFHDVGEAERAILDLCDDDKTTIPQEAIALNKLADWHLVLRKDPDAARRVLQRICDRTPDSILGRAAAGRIRQLPASREEWEELQHQRVIPLPHTEESMASPLRVPPSSEQPQIHADPGAMEMARSCVERLTRDPNDVETREALAHLYAEKLGQPSAGIEQLELLISMPSQAEDRIPAWIMDIAGWHARANGQDDGYLEILRRVVRDYPQSKQAFDAQRHLSVLELQRRMAPVPKSASRQR